MNQAVIHGQLFLVYPDGFHVMDVEELNQAFLDDNPNRWGIWDRERHIIIAVFWHESSAILSALAGAKDVAKSTEKRLRKGLKRYGYESRGSFTTTLCGQETCGFRYAYRVGDVFQSAETVILKHGTCCYTIYYYAREEKDLVSYPVYEQVLRSLRLEPR